MEAKFKSTLKIVVVSLLLLILGIVTIRACTEQTVTRAGAAPGGGDYFLEIHADFQGCTRWPSDCYNRTFPYIAVMNGSRQEGTAAFTDGYGGTLIDITKQAPFDLCFWMKPESTLGAGQRLWVCCDYYILSSPSAVGDVYADEVINAQDYGKVYALLGKNCADPSYSRAADLNRDCVITVSDLNIIIANWGMRGVPRSYCD